MPRVGKGSDAERSPAAGKPGASRGPARMLQGLNSGPHTKVVTFVFAPTTRPDMVVKRVRHPSYVSRLIHEYQNTAKAFELMGPTGLRVPQPLHLDDQLGAFYQAVVPGRSIFKQIRSRGHRLRVGSLRKALTTAHNVERQLATATPEAGLQVRHAGPMDWSSLIELSISIHSIDEQTALALRNKLQNCMHILDQSGCEYQAQHGDFWAGNLIVGPKTALVDWEWWGWIDLPCFDIAFCGLTMARWLKPGKPLWRWFPANTSWLPQLQEGKGLARIINEWMYTAAEERLGVEKGSATQYIKALRSICSAILSVRDYTLVGYATVGDKEWYALLRSTLDADKSIDR